MPLNRRDGSHFGTLCALDPRPAKLSEENFAIFHLLANLIAFELEADETERLREEQLGESERIGKLREQLIGILGHDLRNPLNTILMAASHLMTKNLQERDARLASKIASNAERMGRMIGDLLDLTRSRLGDGIPIWRRPMDMIALCRQIIEELEVANPGRTIHFSAEGDGQGDWDPDRAAQVISNLISNALQYSPHTTPVQVSVRDTGPADAGAAVVLEVNNEGPAIPADTMENIFNAFRRATSSKDGNLPTSGLGLGLYIVQQIMIAHGGTIEVRSNDVEGTTFRTLWLR